MKKANKLHGDPCLLQGWKAALAPLYGVKFVPYTVLVDENNKVIAINLRGDALRAKVAELLD
jgi:hypothetical protein